MSACKLLVSCVLDIYPVEKLNFLIEMFLLQHRTHVVVVIVRLLSRCWSYILVRWEVCYNLLASKIALPGLVWAQRTPCHTCHSCCAHKYMCKLYTCVYHMCMCACVCMRLPIISVLINECWNVENCLLTSRERAHRTLPAHEGVSVCVCGYPCRLLVFGNVRK